MLLSILRIVQVAKQLQNTALLSLAVTEITLTVKQINPQRILHHCDVWLTVRRRDTIYYQGLRGEQDGSRMIVVCETHGCLLGGSGGMPPKENFEFISDCFKFPSILITHTYVQ